MKNWRLKHGMTKSPEWTTWIGMRQRCNNPNNTSYRHYGDRGIKVCKRWEADFKYFYKDMGPKPSSRHTLERINTNKGYMPSNCQWATQKIQQNNRTNNKRLLINGLSLTIAEWADKTGTSARLISERLSNGWGEEEAIRQEIREVILNCLYCGKSFSRRRRQLYCNAKCQANYWYHKNNPLAQRRV